MILNFEDKDNYLYLKRLFNQILQTTEKYIIV